MRASFTVYSTRVRAAGVRARLPREVASGLYYSTLGEGRFLHAMSDEPSLSRRTEAWVDYVNSFTGLESLLQEAKEMQVDDEKLRLNTKMREITSYSYEPKLEVRGLLWLSYAVLERQLRSASYSLPDRMEERWNFLSTAF